LDDPEKKSQVWLWILSEMVYWGSVVWAASVLLYHRESKWTLVPMVGFLASFIWDYSMMFDSIIWHPYKKQTFLTLVKILLSLNLFLLLLWK
jgi:hypothetical protein